MRRRTKKRGLKVTPLYLRVVLFLLGVALIGFALEPFFGGYVAPGAGLMFAPIAFFGGVLVVWLTVFKGEIFDRDGAHKRRSRGHKQ